MSTAGRSWRGWLSRVPLREMWRALPLTLVRRLWRLLLLCALVGVVAGFGAVGFYALLDLARWLFLENLAGYHPLPPGGEAPLLISPATPLRPWVLFLVPAAGGLLSGLLVYWLAPEAEGHGTDAAILAYHQRAGKIRARVPLVKGLASAITIGSGGSGGREGPITQIGAGFGSVLAGLLRLGPNERRMLMAAGMGAGVGAIFHAPLAGALFSAEVLYRELDLEVEVIVPSVISSIVAYAIFAMVYGWEPLFVVPAFAFRNPTELLPYLVLAVVVAAGATSYVRVFYGIRDLFRRLAIPRYLKPALGGLLVGGIALILPEAIGTGYGNLQRVFDGQVAVGLLFAVAALKILATGFSIGSGGSGGVFGPAVVIGGALGGGVGQLMANTFPDMHLSPGAFTMVGMAGFFSAAANTPISTIIMVSEMTGNYHLLVPSMWVCFLAYLMVRRQGIYENQLANRFDTPVHLGEMLGAVLRELKVANVLACRPSDALFSVSEGADLRELSNQFARSNASSFPVLDSEGRLAGMILGRELRVVLGRGDLDPLIIAADLSRPAVTVTQEQSLFDAIGLMTEQRLDELIVVDPADRLRALAVLTRNDIVNAYHEALVRST
ncbi:MAG TPA: chloride channel protein [Myxococcota bacterium]|nr:chloride channel protein [Myxococcota bacterium]HRY92486.1 chloride channel protein [Myxococcota bacterium]